jgi:uncharacterized protein
LDSTWLFFDEKGDTLEKINYILGKKNGYYYKYDVANVINKGNRNIIRSKELYINDKKEGLAYFYHDNGIIREIINYKGGKKNGSGKEFNEAGDIITLYEFFNDYMIEKNNVNRKDSNGVKQGNWVEYFDNGKVKSEKNYRNDTINGYSKEFNEKGDLVVSLLYVNGNLKQIENKDSFSLEERNEFYENGKVKRQGFYRKDTPVGIHKFYDENGNIIRADIFNDKGIIVSTGLLTEDGKKEGLWNNFYEDGRVKSVGNFKNNRQVGEWKFLFKNGGQEQKGSFKNGQFDGEWKWFYGNNKTLRIEEFENGKRNGKFIEFNELGDTITLGSYLDDEKNGYWEYKIGDDIEKGNFIAGLKEGIWKEYYASGVLEQECNFVQGNPDGKVTLYYENGKVKEEQYYVNGIKEKIWKKFDEKGLLTISILYENNMEKKVNGVKVENNRKG